MFKAIKTTLLIMPILLAVSSVQAENNIIHLWTDSTLSHTVGVASRNSNVFIADRDMGMVVMAISDATPPQFLSAYDPAVPVFDIDIHGTYAFLATGISEPYTGWILIIDIESSVNPIFLGSFQSNWEFTKVAVGNYAYGLQYNSLKVIDYSNPESPTGVGSLALTGGAVDIFTRGNYVYLACQNLGLKIIDVSIPGSPVLIGECDTPGIASGVTMRDGDSRHVYIADGPSGIQIINVSTATNPYIVGSYLTESDALSITAGDLLVYATMADSTVAAIIVGNPGYTKLVGIADVPKLPNGIGIDHGYDSGIAVVDGNILDIYKIHTTPCPRVPGDINGNGAANGVDVTYGISYFKGGNVPPQSCQCWSHPNFCVNCDVNASCQFNGVDITYLVGLLGGRDIELLPCPDCPESY